MASLIFVLGCPRKKVLQLRAAEVVRVVRKLSGNRCYRVFLMGTSNQIGIMRDVVTMKCTLEPNVRSTVEAALLSLQHRKKYEARGGKVNEVVVVTSRDHSERAEFVFAKCHGKCVRMQLVEKSGILPERRMRERKKIINVKLLSRLLA